MFLYILTLLLTVNVTFTKARKNDLRIIGGYDAPDDKYNYIVRLEGQFSGEGTNIAYVHFCSGSVLTCTWVLTAAHCIDDKLEKSLSPNLKYVVRHASGTPWKNYSIHEITEMVPHPNYFSEKAIDSYYIYMKNDIGLAKIVPLILPQYGKLSGVDYQALYGWQADILGYGLTHDGKQINSTLVMDKKLQMLPVLMRKCSKYNGESDLNPGLCLSTRRKRDLGWICSGDSGGPTLHESGVVGVTSYTQNLCNMVVIRNVNLVSSNFIAITPVSPFLRWIHDHVSSDKGRGLENET